MTRGLIIAIALLAAAGLRPPTAPGSSEVEMAEPVSVYDLTVKDIDGDEVKLSKYEGDVLLIVNVASR